MEDNKLFIKFAATMLVIVIAGNLIAGAIQRRIHKSSERKQN